MKIKKGLVACLACVGIAVCVYWFSCLARTTDTEATQSIPRSVRPRPGPVKITDIADEVARAPIAPPVVQADNLPEPAGLTISGVVTLADEKPAAGAVIAAYTPDTGAIQSVARDDGRFRVVGLSPGSYRLSAALEHHNEAVVEKVAAGSSNVRLVLEPLSAAEGKVVDGQTGQPLSTFDVVYLKTPPGDESHWQNILRGETTQWLPVNHPEGRYRIDDVVSQAKFAVAARAAGFEPAYAVVPPLKAAQTGQVTDLRLMPEARIHGVVVSSDRRPLADADVYLGTEPRGRRVARTGADGCFAINQLSAGSVTLTASHPDHLPGTTQVNVARGNDTHVEIVLGGGGFVQGTVMRGTTPLPGQKVAVTRLVPPRVRKETVTDDSGFYTIEGLPVGEAEVIAKVSISDERDAVPIRLQRRILIEDGRPAVADFQFGDASSSIEGAVTAGGQPATIVSIQGFVTGDSGDSFFNASVTAEGVYSIRNLPPGSAWIEATILLNDGRERRKNIPIEIPLGQAIRQDIQFDGAALVYGTVGNLTENESGEVMAVMGSYTFDPAQIDIVDLEHATCATSPISPQGEYRLTDLDAGTYTIIVIAFDPDEADATGQAPTVRSASQTVTLAIGQQLQLDLVIS